MSNDQRIIKKYQNRKLYDTFESRYVNLDSIAEMVRKGIEIKIVSNANGEDITSQTMAQILYEEEKTKKQNVPTSTLKKIIQLGEHSITDMKEAISHSPIANFRDEVAARIEKLVKRGVISREEGARYLGDIAKEAAKGIEEFTRTIELNIKNSLDSLAGEKVKDFSQINKKLTAFVQSLKKIGHKPAPAKEAKK
jgi:polyhydroxyalkanoate synthesis repressor PhaR